MIQQTNEMTKEYTAMVKNCTVSKSGNIGFVLVDGGPIVTIAVAAPAGARVTVDLEKVKVVGEPFSRLRKDGTVAIYVEGEALPGAISYRKLAAVIGTPPVIASASDDEV